MGSCVDQERKSSRQPQLTSSSSTSTSTSPGPELQFAVMLHILAMLSTVADDKACSSSHETSQACQSFSTRHDSRYKRRKEKQRKNIKICTTNKRATKGR
ncbi:hypothetical protein CRYUN_Cryun04dG0172100 [Craigia yunnanensis]